MSKKQKLELTWIGKETRPKLEPRILLEDPEKSYHAQFRVKAGPKADPQMTQIFADSNQDFNRRESAKSADEIGDIFDNRLIFGDNLLALKALEQEFAGKVKCVYIDPPFNTQQAFELYDDGIEHSLWLGLIRDRLEIIRNLLGDEGTLFVHIDDNELGYLIVLLDEIFGRSNRISVITFKQGSATGHKSINPGVVSTSNFVII